MYKCCHCGEIFEEPDFEQVNAEEYYGVSSMFDNYNYIEFKICPYCGDEDIEDYYEDEDDE